MKKMLTIIAKKAKFLRGFLPKRLPTGKKEFDQFCAEIFWVYGLEGGPSYLNAIATMIMHLGPTTFYKAPYFFAVSVKKSMANQVAYEVIQQIREQEKRAQAEAAAAASLEASKKALLVDVSQNQGV